MADSSGESEAGEAVVEVDASERTVPDPTLLADVPEPEPEQAPAPTEVERPAPAEVERPAAAEVAASEAAPSPIPPPKLASAGPRERGRLDAVGLIAMLAFVLVGGLLVFGFARALVPAAQAQLGAACRPLTPLPKSGAAPALELEDLDGNPVALADYRGKFLVVNFWATWCEPCTREWPDLDVLGARLAERDDVVVLAISVDQELAEIAPYLERMSLAQTPVVVLHAKRPDAHEAFGSEKVPDTYFVNREGELEAVFVNVREWGRIKALHCVEASAD